MKLWGCKKHELENILKLEETVDPRTIELAKEDLREYEELGADAYIGDERVRRFYNDKRN